MAKNSVNVYSINGDVVRSVELPSAFKMEFRPDLIHRVVVAEQANKRQPYGPSPTAGIRHSVSTWGKGRGVARVQRLSQGSKAAESPNNVGGRRAFPPKPEKDYSKKVNRKERQKARLSALAALADPEMVRQRGHLFSEGITTPVVVEDAFEALSTTAEVYEALDKIGVSADLERAKNGRKVRAGRGKMRSRRYKGKRSLLLVVSAPEASLFKGANNLPGVEIVSADMLNTGRLAPGGMPGRLAVFSESALKKIGEW
ncbi:MAG TPA: 50S ribosomal protein L4 [Methanomassiliicoccaceae archaeon]|jgi:large subunit ribosomal protein L4e|nr:50S ribosomal protein L4 [Euryarchaeota archaeon]HOB38326.1 50S ribosomal protein L4 [Methanomassiliicoccaceae archaeon]HOK28146.1 50S ribosomal protein L4 [Methanomassiliicoccaceae archaeon]HQA20463.1 50S ribosomal protein L4 [Methanomassiliicoccaceae archaeon]HQD87507.1 50S ribosomal protein L4 [Methanomassiliicoccaceae archaeon]